MRESPLLMSELMVLASLADVKTQTRRIVIPQPPKGYDRLAPECPIRMPGRFGYRWENDAEPLGMHTVWSRYGGPGDRVYVRETWGEIPSLPPHENQVVHRAGYTGEVQPPKWCPNIHMKKRDSRLWSELLDVRVERLQDITGADAVAEGVQVAAEHDLTIAEHAKRIYGSAGPRQLFAIIWSRLNGHRGYNWADNPWVFVLVMKRLQSEVICGRNNN